MMETTALKESYSSSANSSQLEVDQSAQKVEKEWLLVFFDGISMVTTIVGILFSISQMSLLLVNILHLLTRDVCQLFVLLYNCFFGVVVVLSEMEWTEVVRSIPALKSWSFRGLLYFFFALSGIQQLELIFQDSTEGYFYLFNVWTAYFLLSLGLLYAVMVCFIFNYCIFAEFLIILNNRVLYV